MASGKQQNAARDGKSQRGRGGASLPPLFRMIRDVGLVGVWLGAVVCGWQAGGGSWADGSIARVDLLSAALRGAVVWLGLTTIWLVGFSLCQRIIRGAGVQAFGRSGECQTPEQGRSWD